MILVAEFNHVRIFNYYMCDIMNGVSMLTEFVTMKIFNYNMCDIMNGVCGSICHWEDIFLSVAKYEKFVNLRVFPSLRSHLKFDGNP